MWQSRWMDIDSQLKLFIPDVSFCPPCHNLQQGHWVKLNHLCSGYGRYKAFMHKIGLEHGPSYTCRELQTIQIDLICMDMVIHGSVIEADNIFEDWLQTFNIDIWLNCFLILFFIHVHIFVSLLVYYLWQCAYLRFYTFLVILCHHLLTKLIFPTPKCTENVLKNLME